MGVSIHWTGLLDWNTGLDYWTGILDWTTGLTYFWFLHMLWLAKLILVGREPFK